MYIVQTVCRLWLAYLLMGVGFLHSDVLQADTRNVLVLSPFEPEWFNAGGFDSGLRSGLQSHSSSPVRIFNEYLDLLRFPQPDQQRQLAEYLKLKYADRKLDLVVCIASPALSFLKQFGNHALQGIPRIIIVPETEERLIRQTGTPASAATVVFDINFSKTLNFALTLQPKVQHVIVVGGASPFDRFWSEQFRREGLKFQNLKIEFWNNFSMPLLLDKLKRLPDDTIVLYQTMVRDAAGRSFLEDSAVHQICQAASVPVYGFRRSYLGMGIVGGDLADLQITGLAAGEIGAKILKGEVQKGTLIRKAGTNRMEVDWRQMQRWHLPVRALPANASVQFQTPSTWKSYGWKIAAIASLCGAEALLIFGLLVHRSRHNRLEKKLSERLQFERLASELSAHLVGSSSTTLEEEIYQGLIRIKNSLSISRVVLREFSSEGDALHLRNAWSSDGLLDCSWRESQTLASLETQDVSNLNVPISIYQPSHWSLLLMTSAHDGPVWPADLLSSLKLLGEAFVNAIMRQRFETSLEANEAALRQRSLELRNLAGQLITVQEEERQRIARELHDAYCQQIAVLALNINKIERSLSNVPTTISKQFTDLENRIMTLSNDLRHLSHELHPALLKHAGLAAALKTYCREFTTLTGIQVHLSTELRNRVAPPIALCLYRVVQESLNNVAKYAGTDRACVHLWEGDGEYHITIKDEGVGFDPAKARQKHGIGLSSMEERVRLLSGRFVIQSRPNVGTAVQASIPADEIANLITSKPQQLSAEQV